MDLLTKYTQGKFKIELRNTSDVLKNSQINIMLNIQDVKLRLHFESKSKMFLKMVEYELPDIELC